MKMKKIGLLNSRFKSAAETLIAVDADRSEFIVSGKS